MRNTTSLFLLLLIPFFNFAQGGYEVLVNSRASHSIKIWSSNGNYLGDFIPSGSGGLSLPEDILFHPNGNIIVSGFGNTSLKEYDYYSGAYLGDFSSGYTLSSPSKISIGPDSLIYVTQWGIAQSKVVRFDLNGNFIDEFTSVDVNKGLSHLWDQDKNFYIAAFADGQNGFIHKFDSLGNDLGAFHGSAKLDGPTTIWWGENQEMLIADWTKGAIIQFDSAKNYLGQWNSGNLVQPEGRALTPDGRTLIGDWNQDKVMAFDSTGQFIAEMAAGDGLADPNAVRVRTSTGIGLDEAKTWIKQVETHLGFLVLKGDIPSGSIVSITSMNGRRLFQEEIKARHTSFQIPLQSLSSGVYVLKIQNQEHGFTHSFFKP